MNIPSSIFKSYDIRGIVPDEINQSNIKGIIHAIVAFYQKRVGKDKLTILTAHDMRTSHPTLYPLIQEALQEAGVDVIDIELASTPTFYFAVLHYNADTGIILTASHNPPEYNGLKLVVREGDKIIKIGENTGIHDIRENAERNVLVKGENGTYVKKEGVVEAELKNAYSVVSNEGIKPLKVVADTANAMAALYIKPLFNELPCELIEMNFELDGTFPSHQPNPSVFENYSDLYKRVIDESADLGIAADGDGDRLFFVNEKGEMIPGSMITALVARELLKKYPGETILYDIRYTMTPRAIIEENGGKSGITRVGHAFITEQLLKTGAIFGGESSGHMFLRATGGAESQLAIILIVLKALSESNKPMSALIEELRRSYESGEFNYTTDRASEIIEKLKETYPDAELSTLDGITIEYPEWRFNVRTSNTEPLMRLNLEAKTKDMMETKVQEVQNVIVSLGGEPYTH